MIEIKIIVDTGLSERGARINWKTYESIKKAKGNSQFFPDGKCIPVGNNPFEPDYIIFIVDKELEDNTLVVSKDVKELFYKNRTSLSFSK
jgi:hypothetical protein